MIHAPRREGDERNHHAYVNITTRELGAEGLGTKIRVLDKAQTGGLEVIVMREILALRGFPRGQGETVDRYQMPSGR